MATVRVSRGAQRDVETILRHLAEHGGHAPASDFAEAIDRLVEGLAAHPLAYSEREELGLEVRGAVVGSYLAIYRYRARQDTVAILRVLHGRRRIEADFRRLT